MATKTTDRTPKSVPTQTDYPECNLPERFRLFRAGEENHAHHYLGAHPAEYGHSTGVIFRVWAPTALSVSVIGEFNGWNPKANECEPVSEGIWQTFVPLLSEYTGYRFAIKSKDGRVLTKADPYAFHADWRDPSLSKFYMPVDYTWNDEDWIAATNQAHGRPMHIYQLHPGSWRRGDGNRVLTYPEIADLLIPYVKRMGYTHIQLLPIMEHSADDAHGFRTTGYFAPSARYGTPRDFMRFIDLLHQAGVGILLDWTPAYFAKEDYGLMDFDGGPCYEYADPAKRDGTVWGARTFDYQRPEVISFLTSSAFYWLEHFHADGLRLSALTEMLYLGMPSQSAPCNDFGGRENLEAMAFLRKLNGRVLEAYPRTLMVAEEVSGWPMVTKPAYIGGLGFSCKWNTDWMSDTQFYMRQDPINRQFHHDRMIFPVKHAFAERYILPLPHSEVIPGKRSLIERMPGCYEDQFAGLRVYLAYMIAHPGQKLTFMGHELAQFAEWNAAQSLDWHLLDYDMHQRFHRYVQELNLFYLRHRPFWQTDTSAESFAWIAPGDYQGNTVSFRRVDAEGDEIVCLFSFSPVERPGYRLGLPGPGVYRTVFSSNESRYGGWGDSEDGALPAENIPCNDAQWSLQIDLPPYGALFLKKEQTS